MSSTLLTGAEQALAAYARREIDASAALKRVCISLASTAPERVRCAVVTGEDVALEVVGASDPFTLDEDTPFALEMVKNADARRLLLIEPDPHVQWVAVEPIRLRQDVFVGAITAFGTDAADRESTLAVLPHAGLFCAEIGFELLSRRRLWRQMHRFNNLLAVLSANVENIGILINDGTGTAKERYELSVAAAQAGAHAIELRDLGRALSTTFFNPPRPAPK
jgi:hypothetical protein